MIQRLRLCLVVLGFMVLSAGAFGQSSIFFPPQTNNPSCNGSTNGSIVFAFQGDSSDFFFSWTGGNLPTGGNPTTGNGIVRQQGLQAGTYTVFILDLVSGFDTTVQATLVNSQSLTVSGGNDINNCLGQPINLNATSNAGTGSTFTWTYTNANGPQSLTGQSVVIPASPSPLALTSSSVITVRVMDPNGCTATDQVSVSVNTPPVGQATPASQSICTGPVSIALSSNQNGSSFIWTVSQSGAAGATAGTGSQINQNVRATGLSNGTITYNIRPVSTAGCVGTVFQSVVTVRPKPTVTASPDSSGLCSAQTTAISLNSNISGSTFAWRAIPVNVSGASSASGTSIAQTLNSGSVSGRVTYRVAASINGCTSDSARVVVDVRPRPTLNVAPSDTQNVCAGQTGSFVYSSVPAGASFFWTVAPNLVGAVDGTGSSNSQTYSNATNQTLRATFSAQAVLNGCSSLVRQHRVRVQPIPVLSLTTTRDTLCSGDTSRIAISSNLTNTSFSWTATPTQVSGSSNGTGNLIRQTLTASGPVPGSVLYTINGTRLGCPASPLAKTLVVNPRPDLQVNPLVSTLCSGTATSIGLSSSTSGSQFSWSVLPTSVTGASAGSGSQIAQILQNPTVGRDSVTYRIRSSFASCAGQTTDARVYVNRIAAPVANPAVPEACSGSALTAELSPAGTWSWIPESTSISGAAPGSGTAFSATLSLSQAQDDSVTYKVFGVQNSCTSDTLYLKVRVNAIPVLGSVLESDTLCSGQDVSGTWTSQPADQASFSWTASGNNVSGFANGTGSQYQQTLTLTSGDEGTVVYSGLVNRKGCTGTASDTVFVVNPDIPFTVSASRNALCDGDSVTLLISTSVQGVTFTWATSGSNVLAPASGSGTVISLPLELADAVQSGFVDFTITPVYNSCAGIPRIQRIQVNPVPAEPVVSIAGGSSPICPGNSLTLTSSYVFNNQWFRNGVAIPAPQGTAVSLVASDSGNYQVQFTTAQGCASFSQVVRIDFISTPDTPSISGPAGFCLGSNARLVSSSLSGNQWQINGVDIPGATDTILVASLAGTYTIRVTGSLCPVSSLPFSLQVFSNPAQPVITGNDFLCAGDSGTLTSSPATAYQWIRNSVQLAGQTNPTIRVGTGGNYQVEISDANGCRSISNVFNVQNIPANPVPSVSGVSSFCPGDSTILITNNLNPGWGNQWYRDDVLLPNDTLRTLVVKTTGIYKVALISPRGCVSFSVNDTVTLREVPATPIINGLPLFCTGSTTALSSSSPSGNLWLLNGSPVLGANAQIFNAATAGVYTLQVTNEQGCRALSQPFVLGEVSPVQVSALLTQPAACASATGAIDLTITGGSGQNRILWVPISGGIVPDQEDQTGLSAGNYSVTVTDTLSGCFQAVNGLILNDPASFTLNADVTNVSSCSGSNGRIDLTITGSAGPFEFAWTGPVSGTTQNLTGLPAGYYSVQVTEIPTGCVVNLDSIRVLNNEPPKPAIFASGALEFCSGDSIILSTTSAGPYQWARVGQALVGQTFDTLVVKTSGLYYVRVANPAFPGCFSRSDTLTVIVNPLPANPQVSGGTSNLCQGVSTSITTNSLLEKQWLKDGLEIAGANGSFIEVTEAGVYCLRVTDSNGCTRESTNCRTITINPNPPSPTILGTLGFCPGGSTTLEVTPFDSVTYDYTWMRNNNFVGVDDQRRLTVTIGGWYEIRTVNPLTACRTFSDSIFVEAFTNPTTPAISGAGSICVGESTILVSSNATSYQWFLNGNLLAGATDDTLVANQAGIYTVQIADANGCTAVSAPFVLTEVPAPAPSVIAGTSSFCSGSSTLLTASANLNYQWLFNGVALSGQTNQTLTASLFGNYQVVVQNGLGCRDTSDAFTTVQGASNFTVDPNILSTSCVQGVPGNNGSISLQVIGGSGSYSYEWTPTLSNSADQQNLTAGTYAVVVSDLGSGCQVSLQNLVVEPTPSLQISALIGNDTRCDLDNGSILVNVQGANGPFTFEWTGSSETSNNLSNLPAGTYEVVVTDATSGCQAIRSDLTVLGVDTFQVQATLTNPSSCGGVGLIALTLNGGSGDFTYAWSGTGSGLVQNQAIQSQIGAGVYAVTVRDTNSRCERTLSNLELQDSGNLAIDFAVTGPSACGAADATATLLLGRPDGRYQWKSLPSGSLLGVDSIQNGLAAGQYRAIVQIGTCTDSVDVSVDSPGLSLSATPNEITACGNADGSIVLLAGQAGSNPSFQWFRDGQAFATTQNLSGLGAGTYKVLVQSAECLDSLEVTLLDPQGFGISALIDTATNCVTADGGITVSTTAVLSAPVYSWFEMPSRTPVGDNTANLQNVKPGSYRILIQNNACTDSATYQVPGRLQPPLNALLQSPAFCGGNDGRIVIQDSAQFALALSLEVKWLQNGNQIGNSFQLNGISGGSYQLQISSFNALANTTCQFLYNFELPDGSTLGLSASSDSSDCSNQNGTASVTAAANLTNPIYTWKKIGDAGFTASGASQSNLSAGTYRVLLTSAACTDSVDVVVLQKIDCNPCGNVQLNLVTQNPSVCGASDGQAIAQVSGLNNPTFTWKRMPDNAFLSNNDTLSGLAGGLYRVVVSNGICTDSADAVLTGPPAFVLDVIPDSASCSNNDGSIAVNLLNGSASAQYRILQLPSRNLVALNATATGLAAGQYRVKAQDGFCQDSVDITIHRPAGCGGCALDVVASSLPVSCNGVSDGTAFAFVVSGGTGPYSYQLNANTPVNLPTLLGSFANQPAGPFQVIVNDLTTLCSDTVLGVIGTRFSLTASASTVNPACGQTNGQIRVVVAGGTAPYTITIGSQSLTTADGDTTFTGLAAGTYAISIQSGEGCQTSVGNVILTAPQLVQLSFGTKTDASCSNSPDGSLEIASLSGAASYSYFLSGKSTSYQPLVGGQVLDQLLPGTYQLSIRGVSSCDLDTTFTINGPAPVAAAVDQIVNTSCGDSTGSAKISSLSGGNGGPWTMGLYLDGSLFRDGAIPADSVLRDLPFGSYTLQIFDKNSCADTLFFTIGIEQITPLVNLSADKNQICSGETVTFTTQNPANVPNPVYTWMLNGKVLNASGSVLQLDTLKDNDQVMVILTGNPACLDPDTARSSVQTIQVLPSNLQALAQIQAIKAQACIGQSAQLKALNPNNIPNPGYRWRVNGIVLPTDTNETLNLFPGQPLNTVELILFSRSTSACITKQRDTSDVVLVTQLQALTARDSVRMQNLSAGTFLCPGTSLTFSLRSNLKGLTPLQIQWFRNDTLVASGSDTFYTASSWASGNVRIRARVLFDTSLTCISTNGGFGLDTTNTVSFTVLQPGDIRCQPCNLQVSVTPTNINCAGAGSGAITASASGGSGGYKYSLSPNGPQNQLFPFFFNLIPGSYSVTVRDTVTGCTKTVSGINLITQNSYNVVVAAVNPTPCVAVADGKLEFVSVSDASTDLLKYKFRIRPTDPYTTARLYTGLPAGTYQMEVIDTLSGCITSVARTLTAPAALQAVTVVSKLPTCYGETNGRVLLDTVLNGFGIYQFSLSGDPGSFVAAGINADVPAGFGAGPVLFYIRDAQSGCLDTVSLTMNQPDSLKLSASIVIGSQCFAPTGQIKLNQFSGGTGALSVTMKLPGANLFVPVVLPVDSVLTNLIGGQYIFRITDQNNCVKEMMLDLPSNSPKAAQIQLVHPCRNAANGQIRLSNLSGGTAPYFFTLRNSQGDILVAQNDSLFDSLAAGTYSITMADASSPACEVVYTRSLNVPDPILITTVSVTPSTCENFDGKARFVITGGQAPYRASFDTLVGQFTAYQTWNGDTLTLSGLSTRTIQNLYTLRVLDSGPDGGCFEDTLFNIPGDSPLRFRYSLKNVKCFGETSGSVTIDSLNGTGPVRIQVVRAGTGEVVKVDTIAGDFYLNSTFVVGGIPSGDFNLVMTQFGNCGGSKTFAFSLTEPTRINIQARAYKPSAEGFGMGGVLLDTVRGSIAPYTVSFNESSFFAYKPDTLFGRLEPGSYTILVRDSIGCEVTQTIEVVEDLQLFIPTLFTPNGDGLNDQFEIRNLPGGSSLSVKDRWGKEVFSADPYGNDWEAKDLENGTYFWVLEMPGQGTRSGWIVIQR